MFIYKFGKKKGERGRPYEVVQYMPPKTTSS